MTDFYQPGQRQLQQEFQSTALADRLENIIVQSQLDEAAQAFIAAQDHFYLSTVDAQGFPTVSYKGGAPGFVQVVDATTLRFPCFDGNGMWLSMGNIADVGKIGMLFIDMVEPHRVRVRLLRVQEVRGQRPAGGAHRVPGLPVHTFTDFSGPRATARAGGRPLVFRYR